MRLPSSWNISETTLWNWCDNSPFPTKKNEIDDLFLKYFRKERNADLGLSKAKRCKMLVEELTLNDYVLKSIEKHEQFLF